jgi:hypothetical protein
MAHIDVGATEGLEQELVHGQAAESTRGNSVARDVFRLSDCNVRVVCRPEPAVLASTAAQNHVAAKGVMLQERHALGRQCWLVLSVAAHDWVVTCEAEGANTGGT